MPLVSGIQKYSVHDGEGIRTTIFFKGCPLTCTWCHNPETQLFTSQLFFDQEKCEYCSKCIETCSKNALSMKNNSIVRDETNCDLCGECCDACPNNIRSIVGEEHDIDSLVNEVLKDQMFYEQSNGGVTLSGGEVMSMPIEFIKNLVIKLNRKGISINIDTSGYTDFKNLELIAKYVDTFLYDVKLIDKEKHLEYIGKDNELILQNLIKLSNLGARINIRLPLIKDINANEKDIDDILTFLLENNIKVYKINLLPYHNIGSHKYLKIGSDYSGKEYEAPSELELEFIMNKFKQNGFNNIKIGG